MTLHMQSADVLRWIQEIAALGFLIPAALALLYLRRRSQGHAGFTERDWRFLFGYSREEVLSVRLSARFLALLFLVNAIAFGLGYFLVPIGIWWLLGAVLLILLAVPFVTSLW